MPRAVASAAGSTAKWPLLVVVAGVVIGLGLTVVGEDTWRAGCLVVGASLLLGGLIRAVLPDRRAGLLQVRSKRVDIAVLVVLGVGIVALAMTVPSGR